MEVDPEGDHAEDEPTHDGQHHGEDDLGAVWRSAHALGGIHTHKTHINKCINIHIYFKRRYLYFIHIMYPRYTKVLLVW
jgi:hypothetical protein